MAFSRTARYGRFSRRRYGKSRRSYVSKRVGYRSRATRFRKRYSRRPAVSRRRILNVSSRKKDDTMLTGTGGAGNGVPVQQVDINASLGPLYLAACMTYMVRAPGAEDHVRRDQSVFFVGWRDYYRLYVGGGAGWSWRRVVFMSKDRFPDTELPANLTNGYMRRLVLDNVPTSPLPFSLIETIFSGTRNIDWTDVITAPLDKSRITVMSDRVMRLNPGNDSGKEITSKRWTPVRRTIEYDDEEHGSEVKPPTQTDPGRPWASQNSHSAGNVYVIDFIDTMATSAEETLTVRVESKRYWHER